MHLDCIWQCCILVLLMLTSVIQNLLIISTLFMYSLVFSSKADLVCGWFTRIVVFRVNASSYDGFLFQLNQELKHVVINSFLF